MRRRRHLSYTLICILSFTLVILVFLRMANFVGLFDRRKLFVIDLNREKISSLWNQGLNENTMMQTLSVTISLPIAFYNVSDVPLTSSKAQIVHDLALLRQHIHQVNEALLIRNTDLFGYSQPLFIIMIQVHDRFIHLMYLIESLRKVQGIKDALVVFSHDFFSPEANRMIDTVRFVRFTQIFYPYSRQLFPNSFPGPDSKDCQRRGPSVSVAVVNYRLLSPSMLPIYRAGRGSYIQDTDSLCCYLKFCDTKCLNHEWADIAGNFRNPHFTQVKSHWIWKLCFVLNKMNVSRNFTGRYLLLEEDYVVLPDLLHVLRLSEQHSSAFDIVALGSYENQQSFKSPQLVYTSPWSSSKHNMGMAFGRNFFDKLKPCLNKFCLYDDYNWDWSLSYIDRTCLTEKLRVLHFKNCGRVFHTGSCGLHAKGSKCDDVEGSIQQIMERTEGRAGEYLFPTSLTLLAGPVRRLFTGPNGGWGDPRDRGLCLAIVADHWAPLAMLLPADSVQSRQLDIFEPLIPGVSDIRTSVL